MVTAVKERYLDELYTEFGTALQAVAYYDLDGYDIWFLREDVSRRYTGADFERIWEAVSFEKAVEPAENELYHDAAGPYVGTVRVFQRALVASIRLDESSGLFVALDRPADPALTSLVDAVTAVSRDEADDRGGADPDPDSVTDESESTPNTSVAE